MAALEVQAAISTKLSTSLAGQGQLADGQHALPTAGRGAGEPLLEQPGSEYLSSTSSTPSLLISQLKGPRGFGDNPAPKGTVDSKIFSCMGSMLWQAGRVVEEHWVRDHLYGQGGICSVEAFVHSLHIGRKDGGPFPLPVPYSSWRPSGDSLLHFEVVY